MFKQVTVLFLIVAAAIVKGEDQSITVFASNSSIQTDNYVNLIRQQNVKNIEDFDRELEIFKQTYTTSLNTINIKLDLLLDTLQQNDDKLNPLLILSDLSKKCVNKYRNSIPTAQETKTKITSCIKTESDRLPSIIVNPTNTRNSLENYYKNTFEKNVVNCQMKYANLYPLNYTMCVMDVVDEANTYTFNSQKTFKNQMEACQCSGKANIKQALDCSYITQNNAISAIAVADTMINKCLLGQDDCQKCSTNYCSNVSYLKRSEVNYESRTMNNPFYGRYDIKDCLLLKIN